MRPIMVRKFISGMQQTAVVFHLFLLALLLNQVSVAQEEAPPGATEEKQTDEKKESELDKFDDFFGKSKPEEKKKEKSGDAAKEGSEAHEENDANEVIQEKALPMIMLQPAVRVEVGVIAKDGEAAAAGVVEGEEEIVDPNTSRLARVLKVEIAFIRRCCQLTEEQEAELSKLDLKWLATQLETNEGKKASKRLVVDPFSGGIIVPEKYREALDILAQPSFKTILTQEQFDAYQAEAKARSEFARQSEIDATVEIIDHHLMLTEKQYPLVRDTVSKIAVLPQEPLNYLRYGQYIPSMSFTSILKHLTKFQRKLLQGLQQVQFGVSHEENPDIIER